jgi:hypothetical protein
MPISQYLSSSLSDCIEMEDPICLLDAEDPVLFSGIGLREIGDVRHLPTV